MSTSFQDVGNSARTRKPIKRNLLATALLSVLTLGLTACVPLFLPLLPADGTAPTGPPSQPVPANIEAFSISYQWDRFAEPQEYNVVCGRGQESFYPGNMDAACEWLSENYNALAAYQLGTICTEQYGGPELATVYVVETNGAVNSFELQRTNGCYIDQWSRWSPLLESIQETNEPPIRMNQS